MANIIEQADAQIAAILSEWSILTTLLAVIIVAFVAYPIIYPEEADTHPLLLARQASISAVRKKKESAVYRSPEVAGDTPLKSGLNVKDAGAPRWAAGKDGDLRDVWREVQRGGSKDADGKDVPKGAIMTLLGRDEVVEHEVLHLSKEIQIMGEHFRENRVKRLAIYLPNSIEFLMSIFACAFYGLTPVLLPYNLPHPKAYELLNEVEADGLVCAAGNLPLDDLAQACQKLRLLTWVVEKTSRHMDWNGAPDSAKDRMKVSVWHDVVEEQQPKVANAELPANETLGEVVSAWQSRTLDSKPEIVSFSHGNFVSAIASLISTLPLRQRLSPADLVLPASSFNIPYVLCQTLASLYQHASIAITSIAEPGVDLALATRGVKPTVIIASAESMAALHQQSTSTTLLHRLAKGIQSRSLAAGRMPNAKSFLSGLLVSTALREPGPGMLRLILTSHRLNAASPPLSSTMLSDLRMATGARICYALTAAQVAGAVSQTNVFDYRVEDSEPAHFGVPISSVELKLANQDDGKVAGNEPEGEIVVSGPSVSGPKGGEVRLGVLGRVRGDGTLVLV